MTISDSFVTFAPFALLLPLLGCAGAPKNVRELDAMTQEEFVSWRDRTSLAAEELALTAVEAEPKAAKVVEQLAATMKLAAGGPVSAPLLELIAEDPAYHGVLRLGLLELASLLREKLGADSHPRVSELVMAWADGLDRGLVRAQAK
jgi:hypothetical protein